MFGLDPSRGFREACELPPPLGRPNAAGSLPNTLHAYAFSRHENPGFPTAGMTPYPSAAKHPPEVSLLPGTHQKVTNAEANWKQQRHEQNGLAGRIHLVINKFSEWISSENVKLQRSPLSILIHFKTQDQHNCAYRFLKCAKPDLALCTAHFLRDNYACLS
jgi:hypothetical protein